jgi:hypothetical protein
MFQVVWTGRGCLSYCNSSWRRVPAKLQDDEAFELRPQCRRVAFYVIANSMQQMQHLDG